MSDAPRDPSTPRRIILPGSEPDEPQTSPARPGPGGGEPPQGRSRIVLPPGVTREEHDEVPEYPKLRPLLLLPVKDGERELLVVSDPLGVIPGQPVLAIEALGLMQLFDGQTSITDLTAALMQENKDIRMGNMVRDFVAQLDELLMLDSPRFEKAYQALREAYHPLEIRQSVFDGRSYPGDPEQLRRYLDAHFAAAAERTPAPSPTELPRAVMAPHLDPRRTGGTIAEAVLALDDGSSEPLRVIVFGTGHGMLDDMVALTRKHYETPLGKVETDTAFVDAVAAELGDAAYHGELSHREEHSIEFAAVYLRHRFGERPLTIVPILVGGFHALVAEGKTPGDEPVIGKLVEAVRAAEKRFGGRTAYYASVDFSHVGPRFGDPAMDDRTRDDVEALDREAIAAAQRGDANAWFESIAKHEDSTRICGYGPTWAMLRCADPGEGRLLRYERSDEEDGSFVSVAAMVWP